MMRRPQFSLKTLLWLMAVVAAFYGGRAVGVKEERAALMEAEHQFDELRFKMLEEHIEMERQLKAMNAVHPGTSTKVD